MFTATTEAVDYILQESKKTGRPPHIRIGIRGGGCTGFSYVLEYLPTEPNDTDNVFQFGNVKIVIDKKSIIYLKGTELQFQKSMLGRGLKISNPNVTGECGCGESVKF